MLDDNTDSVTELDFNDKPARQDLWVPTVDDLIKFINAIMSNNKRIKS